MELKWITRGDVPPHKKSRVYFCCHESDFDAYFESVTQDLLRLTDCAIWYRDMLPSADDEEYIAQLQQMQLFVMPITTRLLTTANAALDIDFPIAQAEHIPVLPLLQEPGLEELFNTRCGSLMALDKHGQAPTALKFEDKLQRFLNAVLVNDEQAARIRAAFDAYIFLSYRKKDRKYAQELMRLIHKNDFARDIAIWYDEFLVPGEDFNANINAVLDKSALFALTVTPNLLEQGNYVMEHEYPAARSAGKPILPVEMLRTDRQGMERVYPGLPDSITDESRLSEALADALQTIALRQNDQDPEHNFFIGLAYLGGIEVERDSARALALITASAEAGLPEAMDKLRSMYENGDGVKRDYRNAIHWQEQLTEYRRKVWEQSGDWHDGDDYAYELFYLSASYQESKMIQQASQSAQALYSLARDKSWGWDYRYYAAVILGDIAKDDQQFKTAKHWYDLGLQEALDAGDKGYQGQNLMYNRLSILSNMMADTASARSYAEAMLRVAQKRCEFEDQRTNIIVALLNIAATWRMDRDYPRALDHAQRALEVAEVMHREQEDHSTEEHLALALGECATFNAEAGAYPKALEYAYRSLELRKKLAEDTGSVSDHTQLLEAYSSLCNILLWQGDVERAFAYSDLLVEHAESLHQSAGTAESKRQLAVVYSLRGKINQAAGNSEAAQSCFLHSLELAPEESITYIDLKLAMDNCNGLADLLGAEGKDTDSLPYRERVLELAQQACALNLSPATLEELFVSQNNLAVCFSKLEQFDRMRQHYDAALDAAVAAEDLMKQDAWHDLASNYDRVLSCYIDDCDDDTLAVCLNYLRICERLTEESKDAKLLNNLSLVYSQLAKYYTDHQKNEEAIAYHRLHIPLRRQLLEESNLTHHREFLADALYDLAQLTEGREESATLYEQALTLYHQLQREAPEVYHLFRISYCCTVLGRRCKQQGQTKQMEALFTEAEERASLLAKQTNTPGDRRRWATALFDLTDLCVIKRDFTAAHKHLLNAQSLYNGLAEELGNMDDRRNAAVAQARLGELVLQSGNKERALTLLTAASETLKQRVEEDNNQDNRVAYTGCLERLAQLHRSLKDDQAARDCINIIVPLREQSYAESQSITTALHLAMSYQNAFLARAFSGDALGAADACDKNIDLLSEWSDTHPKQAEPPLAVAYHSRSILCAKPEDERQCLEQAALLAAKYPNDPGCRNVLNHLPKDLQPNRKQETPRNSHPDSEKAEKGLIKLAKQFFNKGKKPDNTK